MKFLNIFIDFEIIKNSDSIKIQKELDDLVLRKNRIYVWSKTILPLAMRAHCLSVKYNFPKDKEVHKKIKELRDNLKTYEEISEELDIPTELIGFYLSTDINKQWTLDDWIYNYLVKDSVNYPKVDFIIDTNQKFVDRFKSRGIEGNVIDKL